MKACAEGRRYGYSPALNAEVAGLLRQLASAFDGAEREKVEIVDDVDGDGKDPSED